MSKLKDISGNSLIIACSNLNMYQRRKSNEISMVISETMAIMAAELYALAMALNNQ
jgi:hypothetical protein